MSRPRKAGQESRFVRPAKQARVNVLNDLAWTGERCLPWIDDVQVVYEHLHRYYLAATLVAGKRVLDLGCGEGYGTAILAAANASSVIGVDPDAVTVSHAQRSYQAPHLSFEICRAPFLDDLPTSGFDVIVCFEVIEHLAEHEATIAQIVRLLATDGLLVMSTPDREIYSDAASYENPFHVRELNRAELIALLEPSFQNVRILGQNITAGSYVAPISELPAGKQSSLEFQVAGDDGGWESRKEFRPTYMIAVASNSPLPDMPTISHLSDLEMRIRERWIRPLGEAIRERTALQQQIDLERLRATELSNKLTSSESIARDLLMRLDESDTARRADAERAEILAERIAQLTRDSQAAQQRLHQAHNELAALRDLAEAQTHKYEMVTSTKGWRLLERVRRVRRSILRSSDPSLRQPVSARRTTAERGSLPAWSGEPFSIQKAANPLVSIVIPVYNGVEYTAQSLASIKATSPHELVEIIVVDDASKDGTAAFLAEARGITVIASESNLGFVASANAGASAARGKYIAFLNNDTMPRPGWISAMLEAISSADDIGAVGAKLIDPSGVLQEAGGIIWNDGTGWNYGRGQSAGAPQFNYRREVDYCSAAALMVRRDLFFGFGMFDRQYDPGYYEDTDFCFTLRAKGYRVIYEPDAEVVHYAGLSFGTDAAPSINGHSKRAQVINRDKFIAKWRHELALQYRNGEHSGLLGGRRRDEARRILVIDEWIPRPDRDAGSARMTWILHLLKDLGNFVSLFPRNRACVEPYAGRLRRAGIEVLCGFALEELARTHGQIFDTVIVSRPEPAAELLDLVRHLFPEAVVIYDTVDLHYLRHERQARFGVPQPAARIPQDREMEFVANSDMSIATTEVEANLIRTAVPSARTFVIPTIHERIGAAQPGFDGRAGFLFVGSYQHPPNVDAAIFLVSEIMPLLRERMEPRLWIVGSDPPPQVLALRSADVTVTGYLPELDPMFARARVFAAPLRYGAGMKGKIGQAMSFGLPVVTTQIGAEGLGVTDGRHLLIRDDPQAFADALATLHQDRSLWERLSRESRCLSSEQWSPDVVKERLADIVRLAGELRRLSEAQSR